MASKFNYTNMSEMAARLLNRFGGTTKITITYSTSEVFNVATQTNAKVTGTFTGWGVVVPFNTSETDGTTVKESDLKLIIEKTSRVPAIDDVATFKGIDYRIMDVENKTPGGEDIVYVFQLRL